MTRAPSQLGSWPCWHRGHSSPRPSHESHKRGAAINLIRPRSVRAKGALHGGVRIDDGIGLMGFLGSVNVPIPNSGPALKLEHPASLRRGKFWGIHIQNSSLQKAKTTQSCSSFLSAPTGMVEPSQRVPGVQKEIHSQANHSYLQAETALSLE